PSLAAAGRATWGETGALRALVAVERLPVARAAVPGLRADLDWPGAEPSREEALLALLGGWLECVGPATAEGLAARTGLSPGAVGPLEVPGQLRRLELPGRAGETQVLPARTARYDPADLDGLCLSGAVAWGRLATDPPPEADEGPPPPEGADACGPPARDGPR